MNGLVRLPLRKGKYFTVFGGPYMLKPVRMAGVKMAEEIARPCEVDIPTADFHTPNLRDLDLGLAQAVELILARKQVYVGCFGGIGRTGLFLAILAKAFSVKSPVPYTRRKYYATAVETKAQYQFVTKYKIPAEVKARIKRARLLSYLNPYHWLTESLTPGVEQVEMELGGEFMNRIVPKPVRSFVAKNYPPQSPSQVAGIRITEVPETTGPVLASKE